MTTITQDNKSPFSSKFLQFYKDRTLLAILLSLFAVMFVYGIFFTDNYLTITNFKAIIRDAALYGIMIPYNAASLIIALKFVIVR